MVETSLQRGAEVARQLRDADPAVAVNVAVQLASFGVQEPALRRLAAADPGSSECAQLVSAAAAAISAAGIPRVALRWNTDPPAAVEPIAGAAPPKMQKLPTSFVAGSFDAQGTSERNASLQVVASLANEAGASKGWTTELRWTLGERRETAQVPNEQPIPPVLDDLATYGWRLVAVVVEESAIVSGRGMYEHSTPVRTTYHMAREAEL